MKKIIYTSALLSTLIISSCTNETKKDNKEIIKTIKCDSTDVISFDKDGNELRTKKFICDTIIDTTKTK